MNKKTKSLAFSFVASILLLLVVSYGHALSSSSFSSTSNNNNKPPPQQRVTLPGLQANQFRHAADYDLTIRWQRLPASGLVEQGLRQVLATVQQGVRIDLLSTAVKVSPQQLPHLHAQLVRACQILDFAAGTTAAVPQLYVQSNPVANAYTLAVQSSNNNKNDNPPMIVVTSALVEQCNAAEIQAVLGHELGHLKCEHSVYLTAGGLAMAPFRNVPLVGSRVQSLLQQWRLAAEYSCDRAALLVAQDVNVVAGALLKLIAGTAGGSGGSNNSSINVQAFVDQCAEYEKALRTANPLVRMAMEQQLRQRTHPLPVKRVVALTEWAASDQYARLLHKGVPLAQDNNDSLATDEDSK